MQFNKNRRKFFYDFLKNQLKVEFQKKTLKEAFNILKQEI